ncbi:39S ribosomal protein L3, mitochondrial [Aphelenchoides besseyi]|nr:39S ribosomal protein L3, mitochondrial [Aphelenchoides besseyi]KAI6198503.1 39S ribosomal protein L3, mitochondrial [Aphelenchoides besseyi]
MLIARLAVGTQKRFRRRTLTPAPWIPRKEFDVAKVLSKNERNEFEKPYEQKKPSKVVDVEKKIWTPDSKRCGLIGRKIGMTLQWQTDGTRVLCTMLEIPSNHVIWSLDPDAWFRASFVGKHKAFNRFGPRWQVMVGAVDVNPTFLTPEYRRMFERAEVPCKERIFGFCTTEDAVLPTGMQLDVRHFNVGQYVTVSAKSIDWGFQGVMHRWGMRGQPARNTTKSHRRVGSIGSTGDARVWPGKRLPGHMGYEWRLTSGLQVLRINPLKQVIYLKGCTPGDSGEFVLIKDCATPLKRVENPPFPTFIPAAEDVKSQPDGETSLAEITKYDIYVPQLHRFSQPSIVYTEADETPLAARDKSRAKLAKQLQSSGLESLRQNEVVNSVLFFSTVQSNGDE